MVCILRYSCHSRTPFSACGALHTPLKCGLSSTRVASGNSCTYGFGDDFNSLISGEHSYSTNVSGASESADALRIDKMCKDLAFMRRSWLRSGVRISLRRWVRRGYYRYKHGAFSTREAQRVFHAQARECRRWLLTLAEASAARVLANNGRLVSTTYAPHIHFCLC